MLTVPPDVRQKLREHGQDHVLAGWDRLDDNRRAALLGQLQAIDLDQLRRLFAQRDQTYALPAPERIAPAPVAKLDPADQPTRRRGEEALRQGQVAVLMVAGGQGSRLGFEHPKGMFAIGPVSNKTLFQIHAEKVLALTRRYGKPVPFLVMTSPATHEETEAFFREHRHFGLPPRDVFFFCQGTMPALDMATGKLLQAGPGELFTSPNGHGGTLTALADTGLLDEMRNRGITQFFYLQVDNPLIQMADPLFVGHHLARDAEVSCKIVPKEGPTDKLGNLVLVDGRLSMIEYSDLPESLAKETDARGTLRIWAGSPAIHVFSLAFLERVTRGATRMPFHIAKKKVPYFDDSGKMVQPAKENGLKFEMFIFDVLPMADRWTVVETSRREEFVPLKNASGADSPPVVRQAISDLAGDWLTRAGVTVPRKADGSVAVPLEISPLYALDAGELAGKVSRGMRIEGPTYLA